MSVLKSRPLPGEFSSYESLQMSEGLTYAEESFRLILRHLFGESATMVRREIILPGEKARPKALPDDSDGHILQGELAESVARANWDALSEHQRDQIGTAGYLRYRRESNKDFEMRVVFFRAMVRIKGDEAPKLVVAKVTAHALSGSWNMADVQIWHRQYHYIGEYGEPKFEGAEYSMMSTITCIIPMKDWEPPKFLKMR